MQGTASDELSIALRHDELLRRAVQHGEVLAEQDASLHHRLQEAMDAEDVGAARGADRVTHAVQPRTRTPGPPGRRATTARARLSIGKPRPTGLKPGVSGPNTPVRTRMVWVSPRNAPA
ncbi:hypothetical protein GCM10027408_02790 [Microbacterium tumbae]